MERNLNLIIRLNEDDFEIDVHEPDSGEVLQMQHPYSFDEHSEL